ncbi:aromatase/cyclase [Streptomyces canus]|uniref:aromatase/cyclase n=1 Tax=Streptomyces canus TaxID=58343 RepID=UPI002E2D792C|nr:aromatase/cyclase [Streptomyces canus]
MTLTRVTHATEIAAPADEVYRIIADVTLWPLHFPPTVHAERRAESGVAESIRLWATANGELRTWVSARRLDPVARRIEFEQTQPRHPVATMGGTWRIEQHPDGTCTALLDHHYRAVDDTPADLERIARAVDTNSTAELASLKRVAEWAGGAGLLLAFEDTETIAGTPAEAYDFLYDLGSWPDRIAHVQRIDMTEDVPGLQYMEMDTKSPDGSVHTTTSWRVCTEPDRIVYKQLKLPAVLRAHTGEWRFEAVDGGCVRVTAAHSVIVDPEAAARLPAPMTDLTQIRDAVRAALGANSRATLATAKAYIEGR